MTHDWAQDNPDDSIDVWCSDFEAWFRSLYEDRIDADRLDQLMEWDVERMAGAERATPGRRPCGS